MNRRSIKIHTLIIFFSLLVAGLEFGSYYFLNQLFPAALIAVLLNLLLSHIYLEASLSYASCFFQSALTTLLSTGAIIFIYYWQTGDLLIYRPGLHVLIFLNWFVPFVYGIIRNFMDRGPRFVNFHAFFWKTSIFFFLFYIVCFVKHFIMTPEVFPASISAVSNPWIPFMTTAAYIEDSIYLDLSIIPLCLYIAKALLFFLPIGFYACILLKEASKIFIFLLTFLLPLAAECVPFLQHRTFYIDTYLYHFVGILLGILLYQLLNSMSNHLLHIDFLENRSRYRFFNFYY